MKLVTPQQMKMIDGYAINNLGIPGMVLMENAALKIVEEASRVLEGPDGKSILILAGKGNNGGDAFAAARHLYCRGAVIRVYALAAKSGITGDAAANLAILEKMGIAVDEVIDAGQTDRLEKDLTESELVIDGIFGTGFRGEVRSPAREVIECVNRSGKPVLSIDIPSGVSGGAGKISGVCIRAACTVTFCLPKTGLVVHPGCDYAGRIVTADIGIPEIAVMQQDIKTYITDAKFVSEVIPERTDDSSKGDYGRVLVVTGSRGMTGSGRLCANAALRTGAGLTYVGVPSSLLPLYGAALTEPVIIPLEDAGKGVLSEECAGRLLEHAGRMNVVAAGPGLSVGEEITGIIRRLISECTVPLVLDADALNAISGDVSIFKKLRTQAVITPHPGEMARLAGMSTDRVQEDRFAAAGDFARKWGVITVLKGSRTIAAFPDGTIYVNATGNSGMATGGAGDVLTGIIAGLISQGAEPSDAAAAGIYLHGLAGDMAAGEKGRHGMLAGDIVDMLPYAIKNLCKL